MKTKREEKKSMDKFLYVGIFADERVLQFLNLLETMVESCLSDLHRVAAQKAHLKGDFVPSEMLRNSCYGLAFRTGLEVMQHWNSNILQEDVDSLKTKFPGIEGLFKYTATRYLEELFAREKPQVLNITLPPMREFLHRVYVEVSRNPITKNLRYFSTFGTEKKNLLMDSVRNALFHLLEDQLSFESVETGPIFASRLEQQARTPKPKLNQKQVPNPPPTERQERQERQERKDRKERKEPKSLEGLISKLQGELQQDREIDLVGFGSDLAPNTKHAPESKIKPKTPLGSQRSQKKTTRPERKVERPMSIPKSTKQDPAKANTELPKETVQEKDDSPGTNKSPETPKNGQDQVETV
jgi:hypothetical protein